MEENRANDVANLLGGYVWESGGGVKLVVIPRRDDHMVIISDECVCEYEGNDPLEIGTPIKTIFLPHGIGY